MRNRFSPLTGGRQLQADGANTATQPGPSRASSSTQRATILELAPWAAAHEGDLRSAAAKAPPERTASLDLQRVLAAAAASAAAADEGGHWRLATSRGRALSASGGGGDGVADLGQHSGPGTSAAHASGLPLRLSSAAPPPPPPRRSSRGTAGTLDLNAALSSPSPSTHAVLQQQRSAPAPGPLLHGVDVSPHRPIPMQPQPVGAAAWPDAGQAALLPATLRTGSTALSCDAPAGGPPAAVDGDAAVSLHQLLRCINLACPRVTWQQQQEAQGNTLQLSRIQAMLLRRYTARHLLDSFLVSQGMPRISAAALQAAASSDAGPGNMVDTRQLARHRLSLAELESALVASNLFKNPALANRKLELSMLSQALAASGGVFALSLMRGTPAAVADTNGRGRPSDGAGGCADAHADADVSRPPAAPATAVTATSAAATSPGSDDDHPAVGTVTITIAPAPSAAPKTLTVSAERVWVRLEPSALWRFIPMLHELHPGDCLRFNDPRGASDPHASRPLPVIGGTSGKLGPGFMSGESGEMTVQELPGVAGQRLRRQLQRAFSGCAGALVATAANSCSSHAAMLPCALPLSVLLKAVDALFPVPKAAPNAACQAQGCQVHQGQGQDMGQQGFQAGGGGNAGSFSMAGGARQQLCDSLQQARQQLQAQGGSAAAEAGGEACAGAEATGSDQGSVAAGAAAVDPRQQALLCNLSARAILQAFAAAAEERHREQVAAAAAAAAVAGVNATAAPDQQLIASSINESGASESASALLPTTSAPAPAGCSLPPAHSASLPREASLPNPPTPAPAASTTSTTPAPGGTQPPLSLSPARGGPTDLSALRPNLLISRPKLDHFSLPASAVAAAVQRALQRSPSPGNRDLAVQATAVVPALLAACPCSAFVCLPANQSAAVDVCLNTQVLWRAAEAVMSGPLRPSRHPPTSPTAPSQGPLAAATSLPGILQQAAPTLGCPSSLPAAACLPHGALAAAALASTLPLNSSALMAAAAAEAEPATDTLGSAIGLCSAGSPQALHSAGAAWPQALHSAAAGPAQVLHSAGFSQALHSTGSPQAPPTLAYTRTNASRPLSYASALQRNTDPISPTPHTPHPCGLTATLFTTAASVPGAGSKQSAAAGYAAPSKGGILPSDQLPASGYMPETGSSGLSAASASAAALSSPSPCTPPPCTAVGGCAGASGSGVAAWPVQGAAVKPLRGADSPFACPWDHQQQQQQQQQQQACESGSAGRAGDGRPLLGSASEPLPWTPVLYPGASVDSVATGGTAQAVGTAGQRGVGGDTAGDSLIAAQGIAGERKAAERVTGLQWFAADSLMQAVAELRQQAQGQKQGEEQVDARRQQCAAPAKAPSGFGQLQYGMASAAAWISLPGEANGRRDPCSAAALISNSPCSADCPWLGSQLSCMEAGTTTTAAASTAAGGCLGNACGWLGSECDAAEQACGGHFDMHGHAAQRAADAVTAAFCCFEGDASEPPRLRCGPLPTPPHLLHEPAPNLPCEHGPVEHWCDGRLPTMCQPHPTWVDYPAGPQRSPCAPPFSDPGPFTDSSCAEHGVQHASPHGCEARPTPPWQRARPGAHGGGLPGSIFCQDQALAMQQQLLHAVDKVWRLQPHSCTPLGLFLCHVLAKRAIQHGTQQHLELLHLQHLQHLQQRQLHHMQHHAQQHMQPLHNPLTEPQNHPMNSQWFHNGGAAMPYPSAVHAPCAAPLAVPLDVAAFCIGLQETGIEALMAWQACPVFGNGQEAGGAGSRSDDGFVASRLLQQGPAASAGITALVHSWQVATAGDGQPLLLLHGVARGCGHVGHAVVLGAGDGGEGEEDAEGEEGRSLMMGPGAAWRCCACDTPSALWLNVAQLWAMAESRRPADEVTHGAFSGIE